MSCAVGELSYPLDVLPTKGDGRLCLSFEPRVAQKRVGWDKPLALAMGYVTPLTDRRFHA